MNTRYARLIKNVASSRMLNSIAKQLLPAHVTIFMLHRLEVPEAGVNGLSPVHLERCLNYLCENNYRFISLEEAVQRTLNGTLEREKWVAFSLDDGFAEQVTLAGNIFSKFDCPATCFLITGFIDGNLWQWEHQLNFLLKNTTATSVTVKFASAEQTFNLQIPKAHRPVIAAIRKHGANNAYQIVEQISQELQIRIPSAPPLDERPATWDEIRTMEERGMQFAPHTVTHRIVSGLSDDEQSHEIAESFKRVKQECKQPSNIFCYPSGQADQYDERMFNKLRDAGVSAAFSALPGYLNGPQIASDPNYRYAIPRMTMPDNFDELVRYVSWAQYLYEKFKGNNKRSQSYGAY
ncbi:MAG: hypothetical protein JWM78_3166 [Verrucomicrobiaceae bacterium]|nr:hypothetical protein [Verrucomicrobiaceae bacterium]